MRKLSNTALIVHPVGRHFAFSFAGWMMLAVIMVFATAGGGQAQVRAIGSAFDPSTTAVSLNPKQRPLGAKLAVLQSGLPDVVAGNMPVAAVAGYAAVTTLPLLYHLPRTSVSDSVQGRSRLLVKPLGARAPPHH